MLQSIKKIALATLLGAMLTGCAGFAGNRLPAMDTAKIQAPQSAAKTGFAYTYSVGRANEGDSIKHAQVRRLEATAPAVKLFLDNMNKSGYFNQPSDASDLKIDVRVVEVADPNAMVGAMITGATFGIVPSWITIESHFDVKVTSKGKEYNYSLIDDMTMVQWLPMALLFPFNNPLEDVPNAIKSNAWNNLISKMKADGIIGA